MIQAAIRAIVLNVYNGIPVLFLLLLISYKLALIQYVFEFYNIFILVLQLAMTWSINLYLLLQFQSTSLTWFTD